MKEKLTKMEGETDNSISITEDFNIALSIMDAIRKIKINKQPKKKKLKNTTK